MANLILVVVLLVIIGAAVAYIIKAKKAGVKCIGCPAAGSCAHAAGGCSGCSNHTEEAHGQCGCSHTETK